ncbi:COX15/CtaA family protein [Fredinandcohnia humi]
MRIRSLCLVTIFIAYFLIVFGGYVASSQSGMGCVPDWPLCNGVLIPVLEDSTLIEYAHRVIEAIFNSFSYFLHKSIAI